MPTKKIFALLLILFAAPVFAETSEIRCAQQYGTSYLALMIMQEQKLIEKHAKQAGLGEVKVTWAKLGGPGAMNDALLSGGLDFGTGGVPSLITLWAKTNGEVRGVGALNDMPNELITNNPKVKTLKDFGQGDKIAVTTVKISTQALLLQMAAAKEFGEKSYDKLDSLLRGGGRREQAESFCEPVCGAHRRQAHGFLAGSLQDGRRVEVALARRALDVMGAGRR